MHFHLQLTTSLFIFVFFFATILWNLEVDAIIDGQRKKRNHEKSTCVGGRRSSFPGYSKREVSLTIMS